MPRPERPLPDDDIRLTRFAGDLRSLRERAGRPSYRALAGIAHYSVTALSEAAAGHQLPTLAVTLAYVRACGGDTASWEQRWRSLAADIATTDTATNAAIGDPQVPAPYVGLAAFEPEDADRFFGRDALIDSLVERVGQQRFLAVFGASGAGKSSLLRAGLLARWAASDETARTARCLLMTPGEHPVENCTTALAELTPPPVKTVSDDIDTALPNVARVDGDVADRLLVVDQFEEVFTLCQDQAERSRFIAMLLAVSRDPASRVRVVLGVRADFYSHCAYHCDLAEALRDGQFLVGPMTTEQIRCAVAQPALRAGATVEGALLAAVAADCAGQPGVLPLLSHAMLETWQRRRGTTLTLSGYQAAGGITHAIATTAEHTYGQFDQQQQRTVKELFLRLTALGEGTEDTRHPVSRAELDTISTDILERLAQARLVILDQNHVEIAHEALIRCWPRLHGWLSEDREGLRVHRQLTDAAHAWDSMGRDRDALYRGTRLAIAQERAGTAGDLLTTREQDFLAASATAEHQAQAQSRRHTRRLRQLVGVLSVLLVVAATLSVVAVRTSHTALAAQRLADQQRHFADAQRVLALADTLFDTDPEKAAQLAVAAYRLAPSQQTRSGVLNLADSLHVHRTVVPGTLLAFSQSRQLMLRAMPSRALRLWALDNEHRHAGPLGTLPTGGSSRGTIDLDSGVTGAAFSPSGQFVFVTGSHASALWDIGDLDRPRLVSTVPSAGGRPQFASDRYLLSGGRLYDFADPGLPKVVLSLPALPQAHEVGETISADARTVVQLLDSDDSAHVPGVSVRLWDTSVSARPRLASTWFLNVAHFSDAVVSGHVLAILTDNGTTRLWDIGDMYHRRMVTALLSQSVAANKLAFSPDGRILATASSSGSVDVWDVSTPAAPVRITTVTGYAGSEAGMAFGPDDRTLVIGNDTGEADGALQWLTLPESSLIQLTKDAGPRPSFSPDGRTLAVAGWSGATGFTVGLWDLSKPTAPRREPAIPPAALEAAADPDQPAPTSGAAVFSSLGHVLATSSQRGTTLLDVTDMRHPTTLAVLNGDDRPLMFSPDGRTLVDQTRDGHDRVWDVTAPRHPHYLGVLPGTDPGAVSFSADGRVIAIESAGPARQVLLWDIRAPHQSHVVAHVPVDASALAFAPTGHLLATDTWNGTVLLWDESDVATPTLVGSLPSAPGGNAPIQRMVFSPDGRTLAVSGVNDTVQLWDLTDPAQPTVQTMLTGVLSPLAFDPDGHVLAALDTDGALQVRETDLQRAVRTICTSTETLGKASWEQFFPGRAYRRPCPQD